MVIASCFIVGRRLEILRGMNLTSSDSGHGAQVPDVNGDERDGLDEGMMP